MKNLHNLLLLICLAFTVQAESMDQPQGANTLPPMRIADDGIGQTLIFPYYTVRNDHNSNITITNHTDRVKALKIKFRESRNGREVLDFNLYLGPFDSWNASLVATVSSVHGYTGQESLRILTNDDEVCAVPFINNQEFLPFLFTGGFDDGLIQDMVRATEGMLFVLEMGELTGDDAEAAINSTDCVRLVSNWTTPLGQWIQDETVNTVPPTGESGLSGSMDIVQVSDGSVYGYDAVAITSFTNERDHSFPGDLLPALSSGNNFRSQLNNATNLITTWSRSIHALSALLMQTQSFNVFDINNGSQTEWINTYPTKPFYVDSFWAIAPIPVAPFNQENIPMFGSCEDHRFKAFDMMGNVNNASGNSPIPDPLPENYSNRPQDCWVVNVSDANQGSNNDTIFGSQAQVVDFNTDEDYTSIGDLPFTAGRLQRDYHQEIASEGRMVGMGAFGELRIFYGKPVVGFVVQKNGVNTGLFMNETVNLVRGDLVFSNSFE